MFTKENPRPGPGRPKGSRTKASISKTIEVLSSLGFNPTEFLVKLAQASDTPADLKTKIGLELLSYTQAKAKDAETTDDKSGSATETPPDLSSDELADVLKLSR